MAKFSKTLLLIASKFGLGDEEKILSKAAEFERLLQSKSAASNISDSARVVICLDLAASLFNSDVDLKLAIKCSGLKSTLYVNSKKVVENLLELNSDKLTTALLCVLLQCGMQELADKILDSYRSKVKMELDLNLPQYVCMAVYQACRIGKVKVSKSKLLEKSRLKPAQWSKMDSEWTKFVDEHFAATTKKGKGRSVKNAIADKEDIENMDVDIAAKKEDATEPQMENYEDWKKRVLENAYKQLKKLQTVDKNVQNQNLNKERPSPTKHKQNDNLNKERPSPTKHKQNDNLNKERPSPTKHKQNENINKVNVILKIERSSPRKHNKHTENVNQQNDISNKKNDNSNEEYANSNDTKQFTARRSPRKTPQKFEPYTMCPNKIKGVRLLFPSSK
ncbi:origin recognition complex subunit 6 isoform X2 [Hyposmocoma kahamanoa]|uniref:origin recognition complex subunit 6 isoform X2 n=1 Tax=Hyposmocoma kahamanoa TaxID=1477025 RepID=UPI000E6D88E6|nr:origin recognition complex subunit 6 isoform X2 [Hyposmocoma kahamanoa]